MKGLRDIRVRLLWSLPMVCTIGWVLTGCGDIFGGGVDVGPGLERSAAPASSPGTTLFSMGVAEPVTAVAGVGAITGATIYIDTIVARFIDENEIAEDEIRWQGPFVLDIGARRIVPPPLPVEIARGWRLRRVELATHDSGAYRFSGTLETLGAFQVQETFARSIVLVAKPLVAEHGNLQTGLKFDFSYWLRYLAQTAPESLGNSITHTTLEPGDPAADVLLDMVGLGGTVVEQ